MKNLLVLSLTLAISTNAFSAIATLQSGNGKVEILAIGNPSALKIKGTGNGPTGSIDFSVKQTTGELEFDLESLDTGIKLRNEHMKKKYLQIETFPKAKLQILNIDLQGNDFSKDFSLMETKFDGVLSLHGIEKPVSGIASIHKQASIADVKANFKINIKDYGIETPSFAGVTVTEAVTVTVDTKASIQ